MNLLKRYQEKLSSIPPPGSGCHPYLLSVADYGTLTGLSADQMFSDIRSNIPQGSRRISDKEISDAINKALCGHNGGTFTPRPKAAPVVHDGKAALQKIINQGKIASEIDLMECSPVRLWNEPKDDPAFLLEVLYQPDDLLTIRPSIGSGILGETIRPVSDWISYFRNGGATTEHVIPNPMTGREGMTKAGKPSFQCDATVKTYRFCVVEFDDISLEDQLKFWSGVKMPIVALIYSAGKSVHGWLDVQKLAKVETFDQWTTQIKIRLYDRILTPLGVDSQCSNPSRLSRLRGHYRTGKGAYQRLLWLSAEGRSVC